MARQKSIIKLEGTLGDITFVKTRDGYLAKEKTSMNGKRIASDPAFQRTRENNSEFGRAGKAGKVLRTALRGQLQKASDGRVVSRLTKAMIQVLQADTASNRGERNVIDGECALLEGFDFNINGKLGTTLFAAITPTINRVTGLMEVDIDALTPDKMIAAPGGSTHFMFFVAGSSIDFENSVHVTDSVESDVIAFDANPVPSTSLNVTVTANSTHPLFLVLGIEFLQEVNGKKYTLNNGAFNAMAIVKVSGV